jgi:hypothetical protein
MLSLNCWFLCNGHAYAGSQFHRRIEEPAKEPMQRLEAFLSTKCREEDLQNIQRQERRL